MANLNATYESKTMDIEKDHKVTLTLTSSSFGTINCELVNVEYAMTPEELVYKHYTIADAILAALTGDNAGNGGAIRGMSQEFLDTMAEAGGDLEKALENQPWKKARGKGQGVKSK